MAIALWASPALAQTPICPTPPGPTCPLPSPLPLFPATNWWNLDVSAAPVDPNSTNFINFIGANDRVHPDFGGTDGTTYGIYGMPFIVVNGTQPKKTVDFVLYPGESDGVGVPFYPIPDEAITQGHWIEGGEPGNQDRGGDRHMLIVDVNNNLLYELYNAHHNGTNWEAGSGVFFDMKTNNRRPEGWTSADAAGLAILPGLVRYDEAYGSGPIKHAFRVTVHGTNGHVWPASHTAGSSSGAPPMGARLRLKPGVNVVSADPGVQRIVQAMKTYGLIIADNGSDMYVSGTFDTRWNNGILNPALDDLRAIDFEVIQLGYGSNFADLSVTKTDGQTTVNAGAAVTYTIVVTNNGPNAVTGATVTDTFPAGLSSVTWTCAASSGSSCGGGGGSGNISRLVNLLPAGTVTFVATGTLSAAATGSLSNTASVAAPGGVDPTSANNSATDIDTIVSQANLAMAKTDGQASVVAGSLVTYTITASNAGPAPVTGATVTDTFPASLSGNTWTCSASGGSSCGTASGSGNINHAVNLAVGGTVTFTASGTLNINASGTLSNTATVAVPGGVTDPAPGNNSANDTDTILPAADLSITKTDGQTTAAPGQVRTYTIVVSNAGPSAANGATVTDTPPAALTGVTWSCSGSGGGTCSPSGANNINDTVNLSVGASVTYTLSGTVGVNPNNLRNTATVSVPSGLGDPMPANNSATDEDILLCFAEMVVVPDGRLTTSTIANGAEAWFAASVKIGNSYSLELKNLSGTTPPGTLTLLQGDDGCSLTSTAAPADTSNIDPGGAGGTRRVSFGTSGFQSFFRARLVNNTGGPVTFSFSWADTTMFSPAWSTNGSFDTYYSFQNTAGTSLVGTLRLLDTTGFLVADISPITLPAGQTASVNTASLGIARNRAGTARFTHTGPPGAIVAETAIANFSISPAYVQPVKLQAVRESR